MLSVAPNIVFAPNMTQNAERKHRTQNTNTAHFRTRKLMFGYQCIANNFFTIHDLNTFSIVETIKDTLRDLDQI